MSIGGMLSGISGGATVAITIRAVDQFSGAFSNANTKMKMLKASAKGAGIALAGVGAAVLSLGVASIKTAVMFEETDSKFKTVFRSITAESEYTAKNLEKNFGLSSLAAKQLLSDTGDLLTGFGFTAKEALEMSDQVNQLAVDLASFTNIEGGAERASQALTKALLGERESVKSLGIAILETDIKQKGYEMGLLSLSKSGKGFTGELSRQEKAQITLQIAIEQSKNAIGDYERTQDSAANKVRLLQSRFENLKVEMGQNLLPAFNKATDTLLNNSDALTIAASSIGTFLNVVVTGAVEAIKYLELFGATIGVVASIVASKEFTFAKDFKPKMTSAVDDIFGDKSFEGVAGTGVAGTGGGIGGIGGAGVSGVGGARTGGTGGVGSGSINQEEEDVLLKLLEAKRRNLELDDELDEKLSNGVISQLEYQEAMTKSNTQLSQSTITAANFGYEMDFLTTAMDDVTRSVIHAREAEQQRSSSLSGRGGSGSSYSLTGSSASAKHQTNLASAMAGNKTKTGPTEDYGDTLGYINEHGVRVNQVQTGTKTSSTGGKSIVMSFYNQANPKVVAQDLANELSTTGAV